MHTTEREQSTPDALIVWRFEKLLRPLVSGSRYYWFPSKVSTRGLVPPV